MFEKLRNGRFLVLGRAGMDLYADPPGTCAEEAQRFTSALGGSAANIAAGIARLGGAATLLTTISDDAVGRFVRRELTRYGVDFILGPDGPWRNADLARRGGDAARELPVGHLPQRRCRFCSADGSCAGDRPLPLCRLDRRRTALAIEPSRSATLLAMRRARLAGLSVILDVDYRPYWLRPSAAEAAETCLAAARASDLVVGNNVEFDVMAGGAGGLDLAQQLATGCDAVVCRSASWIGFFRDPQFRNPH